MKSINLVEVTSNNPGERFWYDVTFGETCVGRVKTEYNPYNYKPKAYVIYELFINKEYRKKGYGKAVLNTLKTKAIKEGCSRVIAWIRPLDKDLVEKDLKIFYKSCGFGFEEKEGKTYAVIKLNPCKST
jgi:GNAT superfamily N-acetyltransferase